MLFLLALGACVACTNGGPGAEGESAISTPTTTPDPSSGTTTTIDSLGLSFRLPASFQEVEEPRLVFLARSTNPPAIFSIDKASPGVVDHEPVGDESVAPADIGPVEAVVLYDASLQGLPPEVNSHELLVANGSRSFTVILTARDQDLFPMWEEFVDSVTVDPP